jgi:hypothetical protein
MSFYFPVRNVLPYGTYFQISFAINIYEDVNKLGEYLEEKSRIGHRSVDGGSVVHGSINGSTDHSSDGNMEYSETHLAR